MSNNHNPVTRPLHYTSGQYECINVMLDVFGAEAVRNFCLLNAFKYVWRCKRKNGTQDVEKAIWYLNKWKDLGEILDAHPREDE